MKTIVQITAGLAPEEALRFVDLLARKVRKSAKFGARITRRSTKRSMARLEFTELSDGIRRDLFDLQGTHLLHDGSRGRGARKRWFVGVLVWDDAFAQALREVDVRFEYCRAGGPGGQHVNRTASAVRATHAPTGLSVRVQAERSQHRNKHAALRLLKSKYKESFENGQIETLREKRRTGFAFERGNPVKEYVIERGKLRALYDHERTAYAK